MMNRKLLIAHLIAIPSVIMHSLVDVKNFSLNKKTSTSQIEKSSYPKQTDWKAKLKGQTNGKRECDRRMKQMGA